MSQVSDSDTRVMLQLTEARNWGSLSHVFIKYLHVVSDLPAIVLSPEVTNASEIKILPSKRLKNYRKICSCK